ncbi:MAG: hypothetical protein AB8G14_19220 [Ilumatobacter sp.]
MDGDRLSRVGLALGDRNRAAMLTTTLDRGWIRRGHDECALTVTRSGRQGVQAAFGITLEESA